MNLDQRISILADIGNLFSDICNSINNESFPSFEIIYANNPWFSEENVKFSLNEWSEQLTEENLRKWISKYPFNENTGKGIKLGIVMAGNIPLVGLHDFICGFITGCEIRIKLSSKDNILMKWLIEYIIRKNPELSSKIIFTEDQLSDFNAVIATGSNNTNRYFEYYFKDYEKILRRNRSSLAILDGNESEETLHKLADDIFMYFGLGCRNISKLYLPQGYDFNNLGEAFQKYIHLIDCHKFANNFNYQYTILSMNITKHVNTKNCLLIESTKLSSPISVINYEFYDDVNDIIKQTEILAENLQCIVTENKKFENSIPFGETQKPIITDYADNIDTIDFIINLKR